MDGVVAVPSSSSAVRPRFAYLRRGGGFLQNKYGRVKSTKPPSSSAAVVVSSPKNKSRSSVPSSAAIDSTWQFEVAEEMVERGDMTLTGIHNTPTRLFLASMPINRVRSEQDSDSVVSCPLSPPSPPPPVATISSFSSSSLSTTFTTERDAALRLPARLPFTNFIAPSYLPMRYPSVGVSDVGPLTMQLHELTIKLQQDRLILNENKQMALEEIEKMKDQLRDDRIKAEKELAEKRRDFEEQCDVERRRLDGERAGVLKMKRLGDQEMRKLHLDEIETLKKEVTEERQKNSSQRAKIRELEATVAELEQTVTKMKQEMAKNRRSVTRSSPVLSQRDGVACTPEARSVAPKPMAASRSAPASHPALTAKSVRFALPGDDTASPSADFLKKSGDPQQCSTADMVVRESGREVLGIGRILSDGCTIYGYPNGESKWICADNSLQIERILSSGEMRATLRNGTLIRHFSSGKLIIVHAMGGGVSSYEDDGLLTETYPGRPNETFQLSAMEVGRRYCIRDIDGTFVVKQTDGSTERRCQYYGLRRRQNGDTKLKVKTMDSEVELTVMCQGWAVVKHVNNAVAQDKRICLQWT